MQRPEMKACHAWLDWQGMGGTCPAKENSLILMTEHLRDLGKWVLGWKLHFRKIALLCSKGDGSAGAGMVARRPQWGIAVVIRETMRPTQTAAVFGDIGRGLT